VYAINHAAKMLHRHMMKTFRKMKNGWAKERFFSKD
jgi:hypothetical protein